MGLPYASIIPLSLALVILVFVTVVIYTCEEYIKLMSTFVVFIITMRILIPSAIDVVTAIITTRAESAMALADINIPGTVNYIVFQTMLPLLPLCCSSDVWKNLCGSTR